MTTLKAEGANGKAYRAPEKARREIGAFIEYVCDTPRLHPALDDQSVIEFEPKLGQSRNRQLQADTAFSLDWGNCSPPWFLTGAG
ncbi:MAG: hypothetical protein ABR970_22975 [Roseiarcus sp.]|jgi:hypothetical protein